MFTTETHMSTTYFKLLWNLMFHCHSITVSPQDSALPLAHWRDCLWARSRHLSQGDLIGLNRLNYYSWKFKLKVRKTSYSVVVCVLLPDRVLFGDHTPWNWPEPLSVCGSKGLGPAGEDLIQTVGFQKNDTVWCWGSTLTERDLLLGR